MNGAKVLITGSTGFIGSHLANRLAGRNEVVALVVDVRPGDIPREEVWGELPAGEGGPERGGDVPRGEGPSRPGDVHVSKGSAG